jgi:hypothetical protein
MNKKHCCEYGEMAEKLSPHDIFELFMDYKKCKQTIRHLLLHKFGTDLNEMEKEFDDRDFMNREILFDNHSVN